MEAQKVLGGTWRQLEDEITGRDHLEVQLRRHRQLQLTEFDGEPEIITTRAPHGHYHLDYQVCRGEPPERGGRVLVLFPPWNNKFRRQKAEVISIID
ncbi:hypothetical protein RUM43_009052 [Polyplax serrata]|uniref:Uncharacterized protein n=1 Tax=Polyplax serrata TaxID=468196 RepID=A0AAN8NNS9_POLSC